MSVPVASFRPIAALLILAWCLPWIAPRFLPGEARSFVCSLIGDKTANLPAGEAAVAESQDPEVEHRRVCRCLNCSGGARCCCLTARGPREGTVLRALCDIGLPETVVSVSMFKVCFPSLTAIGEVPTVDLRATGLPNTATRTVASRFPEPSVPPPRLS
ncbi:MAG: hypothetical protein SFU56_19550 [Capsulimonadales bacterium]|nr:hypothetical protein [Capsulimonadales bacterium]